VNKRSVLVISSKEDVHCNPVIRHLKLIGREVFRFNTEDILTGNRVLLLQTNTEEKLRIISNEVPREISLEEIGSIWFRRPLPPDLSQAYFEDQRDSDFSSLETEHFLRSLYPFLKSKYWLSPPWILNFEKSKIRQASIARTVGFTIPESIFTNDPQEAVAFADRHGRVALKTLGARGFNQEEKFHAFYTTIVDSKDIKAYEEAIKSSMNFIQQAISKAYELRVTVVGNEIFPVKIDSQASAEIARDDWRRADHRKIPHEATQLPEIIVQSIHAFLNIYELEFGCFDFIVTPSGDYVFLECNGNGQWLWIEELTGLPISWAIAKLLDSRC